MGNHVQAVPIAPALWQLGPRLVLDVPELLDVAHVADTEENRAAVMLAVRLLCTGVQLFTQQVPPVADER